MHAHKGERLQAKALLNVEGEEIAVDIFMHFLAY